MLKRQHSPHHDLLANLRDQRPLRVLAVGDVDQVEFTDARSSLESEATVTVAPNTAAANDSPHPFDLVMVFQSRPGSIPIDWIRQARKRMPLAGFAVLLGSWCEGEQRTGSPLPIYERVFWYQFDPWWRTVHEAWRAGRPTNWQGAKVMCGGVEAPIGETARQRLIAIDAPDADAAEAIITSCEAIGYSACWSPAWRARPLSSQPAAGIWVGGQLNQNEEQRLSRFREIMSPDTPLIVLLDFPRRDRVERAIGLGATAVLGKPWRLTQLAACVAKSHCVD
ncbi:MAG: hypothetical protein ACR2NU_09240 [Aeoliella sp.]